MGPEPGAEALAHSAEAWVTRDALWESSMRLPWWALSHLAAPSRDQDARAYTMAGS